DNLLRRRERLARGRLVHRAYSISYRPRLSHGVEIGGQKERSSSSSAGTVGLKPWSSLMRTLSREFFPMTISTRSANWCGGTNRACAVCFDNSHAQTFPWPTIWHRKPSFALTRTSVAFAAKRDFPPGFTESLTTAFARMRANAKSL